MSTYSARIRKTQNMTGALVRNGLDKIHYVWSALEKVSNEKLDETDMLQVILA